MARQLRREGWVRKVLQKRDLAGIVGTAFAAGAGAYHTLRMNHEEGGQPLADLNKVKAGAAAMGIADRILHQHLERIERDGFIVNATDDLYLTQMPTRVQKAVAKYVQNDPLLPTWKIVSVEQELPEHGGARPDLIVRDDLGLAVVDLKSKVELRQQWKAKTVADYQNHDQMFHYAWAVGEAYGEPVQRYYIALVVFEPTFSVELLPNEINQETLSVWLQGRRRVWDLMAQEDRGDAVPFMSDKHADNFGRCDYEEACFRWHYDTELMKNTYLNTKDVQEVQEEAA